MFIYTHYYQGHTEFHDISESYFGSSTSLQSLLRNAGTFPVWPADSVAFRGTGIVADLA